MAAMPDLSSLGLDDIGHAMLWVAVFLIGFCFGYGVRVFVVRRRERARAIRLPR
jgi:hypothetical protein